MRNDTSVAGRHRSARRRGGRRRLGRLVVTGMLFVGAAALLVGAGFLAGHITGSASSAVAVPSAPASATSSGTPGTTPSAPPSTTPAAPAAPAPRDALPAPTESAPSPAPVDSDQEPVDSGLEPVAAAVARLARETPVAVTTPPPVDIRVPDLDIAQPLIGLRVRASVLQVPEDYADIGWWSTGPTPGSEGAAVVVGHLDSVDGPAVFARLATLEPGAPIEVRRSDGSTAVFEVHRVERHPRNDFPAEQVYRVGGRPALHLLTCGGAYDRAAGRYTENVVTFAYLVDIRD